MLDILNLNKLDSSKKIRLYRRIFLKAFRVRIIVNIGKFGGESNETYWCVN